MMNPRNLHGHICSLRFGRFLYRKFFLVCFLSGLTSLLACIFLLEGKYTFIWSGHGRRGFNYSKEVEEYEKLGYIVHTPNCQILNVPPWDKQILPFFGITPKTVNTCHSERKRWTYTVGSVLFINTTGMKETGHSLASVACCYMEINRLEDTEEDYDLNSDFRIKFSRNCIPLTSTATEFQDVEFIRVLCHGKYWPMASDIFYRQFHALPLHSKNPAVKRKINFWRNVRINKTSEGNQSVVPVLPNFVILGIDSMSRLSFQRNMPKTIQVLRDIGAVELLGYTKVGENSFPNAAAFLSGYSEEELEKFCYFSKGTLQDNCPYIWKRFSKANYLTALIEDVPLLGTFNYFKTGFVKQPTDYYLRPFMLGVHNHSPVWTYAIPCIGEKTVDETLLNYLDELHRMAEQKQTPIFLYSWLTNLAHEFLIIDPAFDTIYSNFLLNLDLNNTVFILMSDHGYRFGEIRQTFPGWYEDKLPTFWVYLPLVLENRFPSWKQSLLTNSKRLTSPYDLYQTMSHFLDKLSGVKEEGKRTFSRKHGQSLFKKIPISRTCIDAGIPASFCACISSKTKTSTINVTLATAKFQV